MKDELVAEVTDINARLQALERRIAQGRQEWDMVQGNLTNARAMLAKLEPIVADLKGQRESLLAEIKTYEEKISTLKAEYKRLRAPLDAIPT